MGTSGRQIIAVVVGALLVLVVLVACSGDSDDGASDDGESTVDVVEESTPEVRPDAGDGDGGGGSTDAGGTPPSVGDDFPVPVPEGWETDVLDEIGISNSGGVQLLYANDDFDRVVAFYEDWISSQSASFERSEVDDTVTFLSFEPGFVSIGITQNVEDVSGTKTQLLATATE